MAVEQIIGGILPDPGSDLYRRSRQDPWNAVGLVFGGASAMKFVYTVWFCDPNLLSDEQDYEWPDCFIVDAPSVDQAATWGNQLASEYDSLHRLTSTFRAGSPRAPE